MYLSLQYWRCCIELPISMNLGWQIVCVIECLMMEHWHCHFVFWHSSCNWSGTHLIFRAKIQPSASYKCRDVRLVVIFVRTLRINMQKMPSWWVQWLDVTDVRLLSSGGDHRFLVSLSLLSCPRATGLSLSLRAWLILHLSSALCLQLSRWWGTITEDLFWCFGGAFSSSMSRSIRSNLPFTRPFLELRA